MSGGYGRGPSSNNKILEILCARPYLTIFIIWAVVYIPLTGLIGSNFPEDRSEVTFSKENLFSSDEDLMEYYDNVTETNLLIDLKNEEVRAIASTGYIPLRLELNEQGKIYTDSPYVDNRTWDLNEDELDHIRRNGRNITWRMDVYKKETDAPFYRDRGETILEGKMLYRDVPTLNPPLINIFWIVPALLGGSFMVFRAYFAFFALGCAFLLMMIYKEEGKFRAVAHGSLVLLNPLTIYSTIGAVQDDIIVAFLFIFTMLFIVSKKVWLTPVAIGIGMAAKIFHILMLPGILSEKEPFVDRAIKLGFSIVVLTAIMAPFFFLAPDGFLTFLKLYFTGDSGDALQGISLWRYLGEIGYPPFLNTVLVLLAGISLLVVTMRKRFGLLDTTLLFLITFLVLFPKIHSGYYLIFLAFIPYLWKYGMWRIGLPIAGSLVLVLDIMNSMGLEQGALVFLPVMVSLTLNVIMVLLFIRIFKDSYGSRDVLSGPGK